MHDTRNVGRGRRLWAPHQCEAALLDRGGAERRKPCEVPGRFRTGPPRLWRGTSADRAGWSGREASCVCEGWGARPAIVRRRARVATGLRLKAEPVSEKGRSLVSLGESCLLPRPENDGASASHGRRLRVLKSGRAGGSGRVSFTSASEGFGRTGTSRFLASVVQPCSSLPLAETRDVAWVGLGPGANVKRASGEARLEPRAALLTDRVVDQPLELCARADSRGCRQNVCEGRPSPIVGGDVAKSEGPRDLSTCGFSEGRACPGRGSVERGWGMGPCFQAD